jgi:hypothetical protein
LFASVEPDLVSLRTRLTAASPAESLATVASGLRRLLQLLLVVAVLLTVVSVGGSFLGAETSVDELSTETGGTLVATIDGTGPGQLVAYGPDGNVRYRNRTYDIYHDVDPSPVGEQTVLYVASDRRPTSAVREQFTTPNTGATTRSNTGATATSTGTAVESNGGATAGSNETVDCGDTCLVNVIERVNLTTGEVTRLHASVDDTAGSSQTHDVDRVNDSVVLVGDISFPDRVYTLNTTTGEILWEWRVSSAFSTDSGGRYPGDWTHLNDVELLPDGRVMVNLRNHDQVVFIEPGAGLQPSWTLGTDGNHSRLYEPHNPDYIPRSRGGPAVVIADSENNRLVEYQRENGSWERSWHWADRRLQWPRDADRLPSGRTLVADSHGSRVLVVGRNGSRAWSAPFPDGVYDVELLGTGAESTGPSATRAGLDSRRVRTEGLAPAYRVATAVPPLVLHGLLFVLPTWTTTTDAVLLLVTAGVAAVLLAVEAVTRLWRRLSES